MHYYIAYQAGWKEKFEPLRYCFLPYTDYNMSVLCIAPAKKVFA